MELMKKNVKITSNEIAEMTGKEHKIVMRDIREIISQFESTDLNSEICESTYQGTRRIEKNFTLSKDGLMLIITGYSATHRMKLIKYCRELEEKLGTLNLPRTYKEALVELVEAIDAKERLEEESIENAPKVEYHDSILLSHGEFTTTQIVSSISLVGITSAKTLNKILKELKVQRKVGGCWVLTSRYAGNGYESASIHQLDSDRTVQAMKWTEKGRKFIYEKLKQVGYVDVTIKKTV